MGEVVRVVLILVAIKWVAKQVPAVGQYIN